MGRRALDSTNPAIRAIERWKRGAAALLVVTLVGGGSGLLVGAAVYTGLEWINAPVSQSSAFVLAAISVAPWALGNRQILKTVGSFASSPDDEPANTVTPGQ